MKMHQVQKINISNFSSISRKTQELIIAINNQDIIKVRETLHKKFSWSGKAKVNTCCNKGYPLLYYALSYWPEVVETLIDRGANKSVAKILQTTGVPILFHILEKIKGDRTIELLQYFHKRGEKIDEKLSIDYLEYKKGASLLHVAAFNNNANAVQYLLSTNKIAKNTKIVIEIQHYIMPPDVKLLLIPRSSHY